MLYLEWNDNWSYNHGYFGPAHFYAFQWGFGGPLGVGPCYFMPTD